MSGGDLTAYGNLGLAVGEACSCLSNDYDEVADGLRARWPQYTAVVGRPNDRPDTDAAALALVTGWAGLGGSSAVARMDAAAGAAERLLGLVSLVAAGEG